MREPFKIAEMSPYTNTLETREFKSQMEVATYCRNAKNLFVKIDEHLPVFSHRIKEALKDLEEIWRKAKLHFEEHC